MNELKQCPFCGDTYIMIRKVHGSYTVGCNTLRCICLHTKSVLFDSEEEAAVAWNRRSGEQEWIPCSEKLPGDDEMEDDEIVLVSDGVDYAVAFWRSDADAWDDPLHGWLDSFGFEVKAWMPLPESYTERREG